MNYTFRFGPIWDRFDQLLDGVWLSVWISAIIIAVGLAIGILGAMATRSRYPRLRTAARIYVEVIRDTPLLAQIFFVYFGLPGLGLKIDGLTASLITLSINLGAYNTEIIRGGLDAVPNGQVEAATALGLTPVQVFFLVVLKQAIKVMFPSLANQLTLMMLATSIVSQVAVTDLFYVAGLIDSLTYRSFEVYIVACGLYLLMAIALRLFFAGVYWAFIRERKPRAMVRTS